MAHGRLQDKVALITGGTSGIGAATARLFVQEGAQVAFTGRRRAKGEALAQEIGSNAHYIHADHTQLADCERCVAETVARHGRIDILFNNAGIVTKGTAETTSLHTWQATLDLNVTAVWQMSRLVLPYFRAQGGGVIINNASDWGLVGGKDALAYCVSKGAVVQMTRAMALDHARENIRINAVCPGDTFVDRWVEKGYFEDSNPVTIAQGLAETGAALPLGRVGQAEEIAKAVLFLACDDSSFITGVLLPVDGGNTAA
ncbi:MAG: SDR family oxidoreductase [Anaerolineae bacterium]|nr:SDR family oxidoreductase [Anaerolineae bacterium]